VSDGNREITGFKFGPVTTQNLADALRRANAAYRDRLGWHELQLNGMSQDVSWNSRAGQYYESRLPRAAVNDYLSCGRITYTASTSSLKAAIVTRPASALSLHSAA
jgi:hypothetical protein